MSKFIVVPVVFFLLVVLGVRGWWVLGNIRDYEDGEMLEFEAVLGEEPRVVGGRQRFVVRDERGGRIMVVTSMERFYSYGERLRVKGGIRITNYESRITGKRKVYSLYFPEIEVVERGFDPVGGVAGWVRGRATELYRELLPPVSASLLLGVVFGGKHGMREDFVDDLRSVGVMHVIAASGMNVMLVAGALVGLAGGFLQRRVALVFGMGGVIFYAFLAGFDPPILRASVMALLAFGASLLGRQYYGGFALFLVGFGFLFYSPILVYDVGFWLSFLATGGLLFIQPVLGWGKRWYLVDLATTVSAQVATLPVLLGVFGRYGLWSVLVNGLVLWVVPFLMIVGALAVLVGLVVPVLGKGLLWLCLPFLWWFEWVVGVFGDLGGVWEVEGLPLSLGIGYYLLLGAWVAWRRLVTQKSKPNGEF